MNDDARRAPEASQDEEFDPLMCPVGEEAGADEPPGARYRWVHALYAVIILVLIATAIPIQFPDLRAWLIGGYGRTIATVHEWAGVAMLALPVVVFAAKPHAALETISIRSYRREHLRFHAFNLWFTLVSGVVFIVTGFVMWFPTRLPHLLTDTSTDVHGWLSYVLYVMIPLHLMVASGRTWEVFRDWLTARAAGPYPHEIESNVHNKTEDVAC